MPSNPNKFQKGDPVVCMYTGRVYIILEPDKKGMASLQNDRGHAEPWNACNNARFTKVEPGHQLRLL